MGPQNGVPPAGYNMPPYYMHPSYSQVMPPGELRLRNLVSTT